MFKLLFKFFFIFFIYSVSYAGGGVTHMLLAEETIKQLPEKQLRQLLHDNFEAYIVGAYYPDSGYIYGNHYGEDSHWDPFIYAFADYIKDKYPEPALQNPKLVAFLFGCATHRLSDEVMHSTFYHMTAKQDFNNDWNTAHQYGDAGIDLLIVVDKNQWLTHPVTWWIPVRDLIEIYRRMGKPEYTANQIIWGNSVTYLAGYGERLIAAPAYLYLQWRMPWTATHYYNWPEGGMLINEQQTAAYLTKLWGYLNNKSRAKHALAQTKQRDYPKHTDSTPLTDFSTTLIHSGTVIMPVITNEDGSVEIQAPMINSFENFQKSLFELLAKIKKMQASPAG
jgi:Zinc dependent phospholipase C